MSEEWGPWVEHDGAGLSLPEGIRFQAEYDIGLGGIIPQEGCRMNVAEWPGFWWRWRTVQTGWFRSERKRVCDEPAYAPVIRYRIRKPRGLTILESLLENLPDEVDA